MQRLPLDELKIDRSLVCDIQATAHAYAIIKHTIALAHDLGLHVVAEGIETAEAATALRDLGCGAGQGYWFAVPMPVDEFVVWLTTHQPPAAAAAPVPVLTRSPTTD